MILSIGDGADEVDSRHSPVCGYWLPDDWQLREDGQGTDSDFSVDEELDDELHDEVWVDKPDDWKRRIARRRAMSLRRRRQTRRKTKTWEGNTRLFGRLQTKNCLQNNRRDKYDIDYSLNHHVAERDCDE